MGDKSVADGGSGLDIRLPTTPGSPKAGGAKQPASPNAAKPNGQSGAKAGRPKMPKAKALDDEPVAATKPAAAPSPPDKAPSAQSPSPKSPSVKPPNGKTQSKGANPEQPGADIVLTPDAVSASIDDGADAPSGEAPKVSVPKRLLRTSMAVSFSTLVHLILIIALGMWFLPAIVKPQFSELEASVNTRPDELLNQVLETKVDPSKTLSLTTSAPVAGAAAGGAGMEGLSQPTFDRSVAERGEVAAMSIGSLAEFSAPGKQFGADLPEGSLGEPQAIVDSYAQAMDRITQEILQMLAKGKVLVIWCFDQSESMKDDQKEIRDRIERVYTELGLSSAASGDALWTAVASYGEGFQLHTPKPTAELDEIRAAIGEVPIDHTGKEMMCAAVGQSIASFHKYATSGRRQMALILVTDESGDEQDNFQNLEAAIKEARDTRCAIYALGREAVFGYPYVHMHWVDPSTKIPFWLRIDRGPETPRPEQLQIDGFHRRWDAHPSGFGPYEQVRLAQQTGGVFFMLPSPEVNLVARDNRKYELEAMRPYLPDLSSRAAYDKERDKSDFRKMLWKVIIDLNPYNKESAKYCEVQITYPINPPDFAKAAIENQQKALVLMQYFIAAEKELDKIRPLRAKEQSPRWRANFDLMDAQLLAYKVRIQEYGVYLGEFMKQPKIIKNPHGPTKKTTHWDIRTRKETLTGDKTKDDIARATVLLQEIVKEHAGTPWAARAQWELNRGFGVDLIEAFYDPRRGSIKVPNL